MLVSWKIFATVVIVLAILAYLLASNPDVARFFSSISSRVGGAVDAGLEAKRPVEFSLQLDSYGPVGFSKGRLLNISITGDITAKLKEGGIHASKSLNIINYQGLGTVADTLMLDGTFGRIEVPEFSLTINGPISMDSPYSVVEIDNLVIKSLGMNSSGVLVVRGTETKFTGTISINEPAGRFVFDRTNGTRLSIEGTAQKISIPSAGISIQ